MSMHTAGSGNGAAKGLFVVENALGHRTVYDNLKAAAQGATARFELVEYDARRGLGRLPLPRRIATGLSMREDVRRLLAETRPDYLVSNTFPPVMLCHDLLARVPTIIMLDATPLQFDQLAYYVDRADRIPFFPRLKHGLQRSLFRRAGALLAYSTWTARSLIDAYDVPAERVVVCPPGIDTGAWRPAVKPSGRLPGIVFVGGDLDRKGGGELLTWFRHHGRGRARLTVVTRAALVEEEGVRVVRAEPNSEALRALVRGADLFVLPTRADCFPNAALEAMASGLPVVLGNVGGAADIVADGVTGRLVPPGDGAALAAALDPLLASESLRREMGAAARDRAVALFDSRRSFARIAAIGTALAAGKSLGSAWEHAGPGEVLREVTAAALPAGHADGMDIRGGEACRPSAL